MRRLTKTERNNEAECVLAGAIRSCGNGDRLPKVPKNRPVEKNCRSYRGQFTSIKKSWRGWVVWSEVTGHPFDEQGLCDGTKQPKIHATHASARETQLVLNNRYASL